MQKKPLVLLFYDGFELKALPGLSGKIHSHAHSVARYLYRSAKRQQVWTGFYSAFRLLRLALANAGCNVRVNDFAAALRQPDYPIGLAGYPSVLKKVKLPNPVIFGPGDYGFPDEAAELASDPRIRRLIQPSSWPVKLYEPYCGAKLVTWPVGIDTGTWPNTSNDAKSVDVLVYDKIRWYRERETSRVLEPIIRYLQDNNKTYEVIRYGHYHHVEFLRLLRRSRSMLFLCEHETQGLACQEAMACNVPVLAWDEGVLVDPEYRRFLKSELEVSSVPYFDPCCGQRFKLAEFESVFLKFWASLDGYAPRKYVEDRLSLARSAKDYLAIYLKRA